MVEPTIGRVLVVDDDGSVCRALERLLRSFGFEVQSFGSAAALIAAGVPADTHCLVSDVRMPEIGGVELRDHLRASGRRVPMVFVTAHGAADVLVAAAEGSPVLEKPVGAEQLLAAIDAARRAEGLPPR
jgi:FixJ family two-component response regulator